MDLINLKELIKDFIGYIIFIGVVFLIIMYVMTLQLVFGESMEPTLNNNDVVIQDKISYRFSEVKRSDIVAVQYNNSNLLVKRVVGLPGEYVEIKDNVLIVTSEDKTSEYREDYVKETTPDFKLDDINFEQIPEGMYLLLGDNREASVDSRNFGLLHREYIVGKVYLRIWPINKFGLIK